MHAHLKEFCVRYRPKWSWAAKGEGDSPWLDLRPPFFMPAATAAFCFPTSRTCR